MLTSLYLANQGIGAFVAAICTVLSIASYTRAIDRFSRERQQPARALANQNAASHLRQLGRLKVRHIMAAKDEF